MKSHKSISSAFTIVELLVVIVVIAILAAITAVAYSGISQKAVASSLQADLSNASTALKAFQVENGNFPTTISTDCSASPDSSTNKCLKISGGNTYVGYSANNQTPKTFLLIASSGSTAYKVTSETSPVQLAQTVQPDTTPGAIVELHAAKANGGTGPGINSPLTTAWVDTSGNGYGGTLASFTGSPWTGAGTSGDPYKLGFDGVDDVVNLTSVPALASHPYSLEAWVTLAALNRYQPLLRLHSSSSGLPVLSGWPNNRILMYCGSEKYRYSSKIFGSGDLNTPVHIIGTIAGPNTTDIHVYINGTVNDGSTGNNNGSANTPTVGPWAAGNAMNVYLSGNFLVARIYPFALSAAQVTANYNAGPDW